MSYSKYATLLGFLASMLCWWGVSGLTFAAEDLILGAYTMPAATFDVLLKLVSVFASGLIVRYFLSRK